jgi:4,5-DOPA dioxygenase extradiol
MSPFRYPTLFISHGTPMLAFGDDPFHHRLREFAAQLPKPKAIVVVSAHSVSSESVHVLRTEHNRIQHDFSGFPKALYEIQYSPPGEPWLAEEIATLLHEATFKVEIDTAAPLDHGVWVPLMALYPQGDVPVVRVSLPIGLVPAQVLKLGRTLSKLRERGVMLIGTGGAVHNLRELKWAEKSGPGAAWAHEFETFIVTVLQHKDVDTLLGADEHPHFSRAHPSNEHFLPIYFTVGAALPNDELQVIHRGIEYDSLSMLTFSLNRENSPSDTHEIH